MGDTRDRTLDDLAARGYCIDEWRRWQQGDCGLYAAALCQWSPHLRFGSLDTGEGLDESGSPDGGFTDVQHHFAYNRLYAYDSAGEHPMPYTGIDLDWIPLLDEDPEWYGLEVTAEDLRDVLDHQRRNGLVVRRVEW